MFRDDARTWADDERALGWSIAGLRCGDDRALRPIERVFVYMPLEHAEDMLCQHAAVGCFEALAASVPEAYRATFDTFTGFARSHRDVIARFGRFPHRNAALGRANTPAEAAYLAEPGAGF